MTLNSDADFRVGDNITIEVSNKPYSDFEIPPESNDFLWADSAIIRIYAPIKPNFPKVIPADDWELMVESPMFINQSKVGWYWYRHQSNLEDTPGLWKVELELITNLPVGISSLTPSPTGDVESPSGSGDVDLFEPCTALSVHYFRLLPREVF